MRESPEILQISIELLQGNLCKSVKKQFYRTLKRPRELGKRLDFIKLKKINRIESDLDFIYLFIFCLPNERTL